ncbi:hypothetical protein MM326_05850 [Alkalihalobacillus sp. LMS6]|uniref:hypothetical protein n=1 Tax=Alkalihalobacillus sp. LMS6 TaxID=2924034 RepID=UPI0020D1393A|nr:hypothetical protein [Alkalihalobacillus sp. LMS6]UTR07551.1 hypothetical protein MM326_05850 [Alkalihalobacillus sp. LMS6]
MFKKYSLTIILVLYRLSIIFGLNGYLHYKQKSQNDKALRALQGLDETMYDLKTMTVKRQQDGYKLESDKQRELTQIALQYEGLEINEKTIVSLAKEWSETLYHKVHKALVILLILLPVLTFYLVRTNFSFFLLIATIITMLTAIILTITARRPSFFRVILISELAFIIIFIVLTF